MKLVYCNIKTGKSKQLAWLCQKGNKIMQPAPQELTYHGGYVQLKVKFVVTVPLKQVLKCQLVSLRAASRLFLENAWLFPSYHSLC